MKEIIILTLVFCYIMTSCNSTGDKKSIRVFDTIKAVEIDQTKFKSEEFVPTEIICDSLYKNKKYKITVLNFSKLESYDERVYNSIFKFYEMKNGKYEELYKDSIQRHFNEVLFEDFNNDKVKDILIENISDVRSNVTYYLYLVDTTTDKLKKIKNFEIIKNPHYLPKHNLIDNMVMSGRNWTSFYKIQGDSIKDFDIIIYDGEDENGKYTYDKDYDNAINKITKKKNYR